MPAVFIVLFINLLALGDCSRLYFKKMKNILILVKNKMLLIYKLIINYDIDAMYNEHVFIFINYNRCLWVYIHHEISVIKLHQI